MLSDRAMWASVALVDYLRNGVPLQDAPRYHVARSLAALMNAFRLPMDEYWERQMEISDGANLVLPVLNAGLCQYGVPAELADYQEAIRYALSERSWDSFDRLPTPVWTLLKTATGMNRDEWQGLAGFCGTLLEKKIFCPRCNHSSSMGTFGEPGPIDDPTYFNQQRVDLVFRCSQCGTEVCFDILSDATREPKTAAVPKRLAGWMVLGFFAIFVLVLFWMLVTRPSF